ncbi:MAG: hypothetical protein ACRDD3_04990 [Azovibrio sp.]
MKTRKSFKQGDEVIYLTPMLIGTHQTQVRRIGTVQGEQDGKVIVLHPNKEVELIAEEELYPLGNPW